MDVVVCAEPGTLLLQQRRKPRRNDGDVLVRIRRVGVCGTDMHIYCGDQPYLSYPRVMGHELAGEVAEVPSGSDLQPGEPVYIIPYIACGSCIACRRGKPNCCVSIAVLGVHQDGGLSEYLSVPEAYVKRACGISLDQAAMVEFLAIGAHAVRRAAPNPEAKVLVVGAGPIGIAVALFAKRRGASVVTVDGRADRLSVCREAVGVDATFVAGPTTAGELAEYTGGEFFDVVFDATGARSAMETGFAYVAHGGTYVLVSIVPGTIGFSNPEFHKREMTLMGSRNATAEDFDTVVRAMREGLVPTDALHTHSAALSDLPNVFPGWLEPSAQVIKAIVEC
ncbi:MAG: zinc-binding alcohol dehydrogenase family protein [Sphingomicrobium sp.]